MSSVPTSRSVVPRRTAMNPFRLGLALLLCSVAQGLVPLPAPGRHWQQEEQRQRQHHPQIRHHPGSDQIPLLPDGGGDGSPIDAFIVQQSAIAWDSLLCNVGPGDCVPGAAPGVVVASPDRVDPPYFYTWTRDSALVVKHVTDAFLVTRSPQLEGLVRSYAESQARLQSVSNPSGSIHDGTGLGEAKFCVDLRPFLGNWGRPQRDGPALRAITLAGYARHLAETGRSGTARDFLWPIIRNDLSYVAQYWNDTGFDLWEEVRGSSFFATAAQHRALTEGAALASQLGASCDACTAIAPQVLCFLQSFWSDPKGYVVANTNTDQSRSGLDVATILSSIHNFDPSLGCDAATLQPCSDRALANHKAVTDSFRPSRYPVNEGIPRGAAVAVGRYPEDVYYDGNPWYLATLASAEQLYDALMTWRERGSVPVTPLSLAFFRDLVPGVGVGVYPAGSAAYESIYSAVLAYADGYMDVVRRFTPGNGSLSEQFAKEGGAPLSAHDLTWSYAAFLTAAARRAGIAPRSWGSPPATVVPPTCSPTTVGGHYLAPARTVFPEPDGPGDPGCVPPADAGVAVVAFREVVETRWGETVRMVGSIDGLGNWDARGGLALDPSEYTARDPVWKAELELRPGEVVEYKFVKVDPKGGVTWEQDPNHTLTVLAVPCAAETPTLVHRWQEE